jgi:hypothetical protein
MAFFYLQGVVYFVLDPQAPVKIPIKAAGQLLTLRAQRFRLDEKSRTVQLWGVSLSDSKGNVLLSMDAASAKTSDIMNFQTSLVRAEVRNVNINLRRLPNGKFEFEQYLSKEKGEPGKLPFSVFVDGLRLNYYDARTKSNLSAITRKVVVEGIGDDWRARGHLNIPTVGETEFRAQQIAKKGAVVKSGAFVATLSSALNRTLKPELPKELSIGSGRAEGRILAFIPTSGAARFRYIGTGKAANVTWDKYRIAQANFNGTATDSALAGQMSASDPSASGTFSGNVSFGKSATYTGAIEVDIADASRLPKELGIVLPKGTKATNVRAKGWIAGIDDKAEFQANATAGSAAFHRYSGTNINLALTGNTDQVSIVARDAQTNLGRVSAAMMIRPTDQLLNGWVSAQKIDASKVALKEIPKGLSSNLDLSAVLGGTFTKPTAKLRVTGAASYLAKKDLPLKVRQVVVAGNWDGKSFEIARALANQGESLLTVTGEAAPNGPVDLRFSALAFDMGQFSRDVKGTLSAVGTVKGTTTQPLVRGIAEAYGTEFANLTVPLVKSTFSGNRDDWFLTNLQAVRGPTEVSGMMRYSVRTGGISGSGAIARLQLADVLGEEAIGRIDAPMITIGGTLQKPTMTAEVSGENVVVADVRANDIRGLVTLANSKLSLFGLNATVFGGKVQVDGNYDLNTRLGSATASASNISLKDISTETVDILDASGTFAGTANAKIAEGQLTTANLKGAVQEFVFNGTPIGAGDINASIVDGVVKGDLALGQLDRFIEANVDAYDIESKQFTANLNVNGFLLEDFVQASGRYLKDVPYETRRQLNDIKGAASFAVRGYGTFERPSIFVDSLEANQVALGPTAIGEIKLSGGWENRVATVKSFTVKGPTGQVSAQGTVVENGAISVDGELTEIQIKELSPYLPALEGRSGSFTIPFAVSGTVKDPSVQASLETQGLLADPKRPDASLILSLDQVNVTNGDGKTGGIQAAGVFKYRGFQGSIAANVPFSFPAQVPTDQQITATVNLSRRPLSEISEFSAQIDPEKTIGFVSGQISAAGTLNDLQYAGGVNVQAENISLRNVDNGLKNANFAVRLDGREISTNADFMVAQGGDVKLELMSPIGSLERMADAFSEGGLERILQSSVTGKLVARNVRHKQTLKGGAVDATVTGTINVSGNLASPLLAGNVTVRNGDIVVPEIQAQSTSTAPPLVNPRFAIDISMAEFSRLRAATADLYLYGDANLNGSLVTPRLTSEIFVERGSFQLPGAKIRLDQGGTVAIEYDGNARNPVTTMQVELEGRTAVTTAVVTQNPERYDVTIAVTGDLLKEGGLSFAASSDPAGLSQNQIIALLGRTDVIESLGNTGERDLAEERLRSALVGIAVPLVFEQITSPLARSLGLDYLSLDYNNFEKGTILFAKNLGRDFIFQGRRQIGEPLPGFPVRYEFRLDYRPRKFKGWLSRISFFVGQDEIRPFKVGLNYSVRF